VSRTTGAEVAGNMSGFREEDDGGLSARFSFPGDFVGFDGHFPDGKVRPGVCQLQGGTAVLETWRGVRVSLTEVVSAKYMAPIGPDEEIVCRLRDISGASGEATLKARIESGGGKVADFRVRVRFDGERPKG